MFRDRFDSLDADRMTMIEAGSGPRRQTDADRHRRPRGAAAALSPAAPAIRESFGRRSTGGGRQMTIDSTTFGSITVDGETYEYDVIIRLSGKVERRKKKLSKEQYGTSHIVSKDEAKFIFEDGCETLIIGAGQGGNVRLSPEASDYFDKKGCKVIVEPTPEAIQSFNRSRAKKVGLMHVTC
jgi:hypothetical protein